MKLKYLFLVCIPLYSFAQTVLKGIVKGNGSFIFAANVYFKSKPEKGTITDFDGNFTLQIQEKDTLQISHINFQTLEIPLKAIDTREVLMIMLLKKKNILEEVIVKYTDPISEQFSVIKMNMLTDVYLNPIAQGDPLKAITAQSFSTNTDETANPSLRGSSADRSRVIFNGVPIINPVRNANLSNQGFFSLLNPQIIEKQYVYASNPSLTFGNTSAGLTEIETKRKLKNNNLQLSTGLASTGFILNQKLKEKSFLQVYANYQFSNFYTNIQEEKLPKIKGFSIKDLGFNFHSNLSEKIELNSFSYLINESFDGKNIERYAYKGDVESSRKRFFTINNFKIYTKNGTWQINNGISLDQNNYDYGNSSYNTDYKNIFTAINYKWFILENTDIQFGISHDYHNHIFKDKVPTYFYANSPESPSFDRIANIENNIVEGYAYMLWRVNNQWSFSSAIRSNIPMNNQQYYLSSQMSFKYNPSAKHHFSLSGGAYHSYSVPNSLTVSYHLLKSSQLAFDYSFRDQKTLLKTAFYLKEEIGKQNRDVLLTFDKATTFGIELFVEQQFLRYFKFTFANSFIHQEQIINNDIYPGNYDLNYFFKTNLQYMSTKFLTLSLNYIGRPGNYYTPINRGVYKSELKTYEPIFSEHLYCEQYENYSRFNFTMSQFLSFKNNSFVFYASANNLFNQENQRLVQYNDQYSRKHFDNYSYRTFYFGIVWQLNH